MPTAEGLAPDERYSDRFPDGAWRREGRGAGAGAGRRWVRDKALQRGVAGGADIGAPHRKKRRGRLGRAGEASVGEEERAEATRRYIGVDIGGTNIRAGGVDGGG